MMKLIGWLFELFAWNFPQISVRYDEEKERKSRNFILNGNLTFIFHKQATSDAHDNLIFAQIPSDKWWTVINDGKFSSMHYPCPHMVCSARYDDDNIDEGLWN